MKTPSLAPLLLSLAALALSAQQPLPVTFTAEQDHQNMMDQLGIRALRPGPSGDEKAPNHANYDESLANPFPKLPEILTLNNGQKVTTPAMWWKQRRPELVELLEREVYGRVPKHVPHVTWSVALTDHEAIGFMPVIAKKLIGHVDNSAYPRIDVDISMSLVTPVRATAPVPVLMMFGRSALPAPAQPPQNDLDKINAALKSLLIQQDPSLQAIFERHPAYNVNMALPPPAFPVRAPAGDPSPSSNSLPPAGVVRFLIPPVFRPTTAQG